MEKEVFVKIINSVVQFVNISDGLNEVLKSDINFGIKQIENIIEALEIQFDDVENWIYWWVFYAGDNKTVEYKSPTMVRKYYKEVYEAESQDDTITLSTAGELYDFLEWNNANS